MKIRSFNNSSWQFQFASLHDSVQKSFYEAWEASGTANVRLQNAMIKIHKLEKIIRKKKYPNLISRIYKKHRRLNS